MELLQGDETLALSALYNTVFWIKSIYLLNPGDNDDSSSFTKLFVILQSSISLPFQMSSLMIWTLLTVSSTTLTVSIDSISTLFWCVTKSSNNCLFDTVSVSTCLGSYETWTTALVIFESESLTTSSSKLSLGECNGIITVSFSIWKSYYHCNVLSFKIFSIIRSALTSWLNLNSTLVNFGSISTNSEALDRFGDFLLILLKLLARCRSDPNSERLDPLRSLDLSIVPKVHTFYNAIPDWEI